MGGGGAGACAVAAVGFDAEKSGAGAVAAGLFGGVADWGGAFRLPCVGIGNLSYACFYSIKIFSL